jgi:hypothetical protein
MIDNIAYHNNTNYPSVKPSTVMIDNIAYHNNTNHSSVKPSKVMIDITVEGLTEEWFVLLW